RRPNDPLTNGRAHFVRRSLRTCSPSCPFILVRSRAFRLIKYSTRSMPWPLGTGLRGKSTMPQSNAPGRFRIEITSQFVSRITALYRVADARGQAEDFRAALRRLRQRLELEPFSCGEPVYALPQLNLIVRKFVQAPIVLHYTVHTERRLVWFTAIDLLG